MAALGMLTTRFDGLLLDIFLRSLILLMLAGLLLCLQKHASAAARHATLALTLIGLLVLPVLHVLAPPVAAPAIRVPLIQPSAEAIIVKAGPAIKIAPPLRSRPPVSQVDTRYIAGGGSSGADTGRSSDRQTTNARATIRINTASGAVLLGASEQPVSHVSPIVFAALLIWAAGALAVMLRTLMGLAAGSRLIRQCQPVISGPLADIANQSRRALGIRQRVDLVQDTTDLAIPVPMTSGAVRAVVLLPAAASDWPEERLRAALLHEMAHIRRGDYVVTLLTRLACALYWFQPLVWLIAARMRNESEEACDDLVLASGISGPDYAAHLLEIARSLAPARRAPAALAMATRSEVGLRLKSILNPGKDRRRISVSTLIAAAIAMAMVTTALASIEPSLVSPHVLAGIVSPSGAEGTSLPSSVVAATGSKNAAFTLLKVSRVAQKGQVPIPPAFLPPYSHEIFPIMAREGGTGLWIRVRGGIGCRTLIAPLDGKPHTFSFGAATLSVKPYGSFYTAGWTKTDGSENVSEGEMPYTIMDSQTGRGNQRKAVVTLIPDTLTFPFHITAQPFSSTNKPVSRPVELVCQVATPTLIFVEVPTGYSAETSTMRVMATRVGKSAEKSSWLLSNLPKSVAESKDGLSPTETAAYGPVVLRAAAAESPDLSGDPDFLNRYPDRPAGGGWIQSAPMNADDHGWTGVPTITFMLSAHNASGDYAHQNWYIRLDKVTPEWATSPVLPVTSATNPISSFTAGFAQPGRPLANAWQSHVWQLGVDYPGQQNWVRIDGTMLRFVHRTETITFHNAKVVQEGAFGVNSLVWLKPETATTKSGISVTVLNSEPGAAGGPDSASSNRNWQFENGNAQLLFAWKLPRGFIEQDYPSPNAPYEAGPPYFGAPTLFPPVSSVPVPDWSTVAAPGQVDARALMRSGYSPRCLAVKWGAQSQPVLSDESGGVVHVPPMSPPSRLKSITLHIPVQEQVESHPFHLLIPVRQKFPAYWKPDATAGKYRIIY